MTRYQEPNENRDKLFARAQPSFTGAQFKGFINRRSLKFLEGGDMSVSFVIPVEEIANKADKLRLLLTNPMPLQIDVEVDSSYLDDLEADEKRLRAL